MEENKTNEEVIRQVQKEEGKEQATNENVITQEEKIEDPKDTLLDLSDKDLTALVEEARLKFFDTYKKQKRINLIVMIAFVAVLVLFMVLFGTNPNMFTYFLIFVIIYFAFMWLYSKKSKAKLNDSIDEYVTTYGRLIDSYVFTDQNFTDMKIFYHKQFDLERIKKSRVVKDINHVGSRDMIEGNFDDDPFTVGDLLINIKIPNEKKPKPVFIGKYFEFPYLQLVEEGRTIVYLKGNELSVGPSDIADLTEVKIEGLKDEYIVYSSEDKPKAHFSKAVIEVLNKFETNDTLIDMFLSFTETQTSLGLSYADNVMVIPLMDPFKIDPINQYQSDVLKVVDLMKALNKAKNKK